MRSSGHLNLRAIPAMVVSSSALINTPLTLGITKNQPGLMVSLVKLFDHLMVFISISCSLAIDAMVSPDFVS